MKTDLHNVVEGDVICDMHDGIPVSIRDRVIAHCCRNVSGSTEICERIIHEVLPEYTYHNKMLVVVEVLSANHVLCVYSYDDRKFGFVTFGG
jgi:hypothetical protein